MYKINPDRNIPWNDLPELPIDRELYYSVEILEQLVEAKSALARLQGRSAAIPNPGVLINAISCRRQRHQAPSKTFSQPMMNYTGLTAAAIKILKPGRPKRY